MVERSSKKSSEPIMIVRPAVKSLGLDYLHMSLIALIIILIALVFALSSFKGVSVQNCNYGVASNGLCIVPVHTSSQALAAAEQVIASYANTNSSLSLLPFYSEGNRAKVSYLANQSEWLVVVPYVYPGDINQTFSTSWLLYDSNLSLVTPFLQIPASPYTTKNKAVAYGLVNIAGKTECTTNASAALHVYAFIDPYAPGALQGIYTAINASKKFGSKINVSYEMIFTGYAIKLYSSYGVNRTQQNGEYLWCASRQPNRFPAFLANYSIEFTGTPLDNSTLASVAQGSGVNMSAFSSCLSTVTQKLNAQALLASYYNVSATPMYVINCQYQTIPETLDNAIQYVIGNTTV